MTTSKSSFSIKRGLIRLALFYGTIVLIITVCQRFLLYFPHHDLQVPLHYGLEMDAVVIATEDDEQVTLWTSVTHPKRPIILYFHGNGGHLGYRTRPFANFLSNDFNLVALSYRGYGNSSGSPSEEGFYIDARAAMDWIHAHHPDMPIIAYGESLGTGIAAQMAVEYEVAGLVLEAPYISVADRAQEIYPYLPAKWMVWDRFDTHSKLDHIDEALLIVHGTDDRVIPITHGKTLFDAFSGRKHLEIFDGYGHSDLPRQKIVEVVEWFYRF